MGIARKNYGAPRPYDATPTQNKGGCMFGHSGHVIIIRKELRRTGGFSLTLVLSIIL